MHGWTEQFQANAANLAKAGIGIGVTAWAVRRQLEVDKPIDRRSQVLRWTSICICWAVASWPARSPVSILVLRIVSACLGFALYWWPPFVLRAARQLWKRDFVHVETVLCRWDPIGVSADIGGAYQEYAPVVLDELEKGSDAMRLNARLKAIREEWAKGADLFSDHEVAAELVAWWKSRKAQNAVA